MSAFRIHYLPAALLALATLILPAQEPGTPDAAPDALRQALLDLQADIERDTRALNQLRARVDSERAPLAERLKALQNTVADRRDELERVRTARAQGEQARQTLRARTEALEEEHSYLLSLFSDYGRAMDTRMNAARRPDILRRLQSARAELETGADPAGALPALLDTTLDWNRTRVGGARFTGSALDANGVSKNGAFATFGPLAYFASDEADGPTGLVRLRFGSDQPGVYADFTGETLDSIRAVARGGEAAVPVDVTGGDAIRVAEASPGLLEHLRQGGYTMIPLAAVAAAALLLALWKTVELARMRIRADEKVRAVMHALHEGDADAARAHAEGIRRPLRRLVDDLIEHRDASRDQLEEIMHEHLLASMPYIERNLGALAVLGGVAPLLGLLGTVTGMIHTFQLVTLFGSGDAKLLSGGISEALVTTETGLAIAIPTLLVHAWLSRRARGIVGALETRAATLVNDLKLRHTAT